jgi:hypothetical protein
MAAPTAVELTALAESLTKALADAEKTSKNLAAHVAAEGKKIGDAFGRTYAKAAKEQIDEIKKTLGADLQRQADLNAELFRQRAPLERHSDRYGQIVRAVRAAKNAGETAMSVEQLLAIINAPYDTAGATMTDTTTTTPEGA